MTSSSDSARPPQKRTNKKKRKRCPDAQPATHKYYLLQYTHFHRSTYYGYTYRTGFIARFSECYKAMNNNRKWEIPSGVFLEDVLYERFKNEQVELAVHSWIVDTCDPRVESCFSSDDWKAICDQVLPLPEADPLLVQSMRRFMSVSGVSGVFSSFTGKSLILPNVVANPGRTSERCIQDLVFGRRRIIRYGEASRSRLGRFCDALLVSFRPS